MSISPEYVTALEKRVVQLENQIQQFEQRLSRQQLPNTSLRSPNFLTRAFTVLGHLIVAQLIIAVPFYCLIALITLLGNR